MKKLNMSQTPSSEFGIKKSKASGMCNCSHGKVMSPRNSMMNESPTRLNSESNQRSSISSNGQPKYKCYPKPLHLGSVANQYHIDEEQPTKDNPPDQRDTRTQPSTQLTPQDISIQHEGAVNPNELCKCETQDTRDTVWTVRIMKDAGITTRFYNIPVQVQTSLTTIVNADKLEHLIPQSERYVEEVEEEEEEECSGDGPCIPVCQILDKNNKSVSTTPTPTKAISDHSLKALRNYANEDLQYYNNQENEEEEAKKQRYDTMRPYQPYRERLSPSYQYNERPIETYRSDDKPYYTQERQNQRFCYPQTNQYNGQPWQEIPNYPQTNPYNSLYQERYPQRNQYNDQPREAYVIDGKPYNPQERPGPPYQERYNDRRPEACSYRDQFYHGRSPPMEPNQYRQPERPPDTYHHQPYHERPNYAVSSPYHPQERPHRERQLPPSCCRPDVKTHDTPRKCCVKTPRKREERHYPKRRTSVFHSSKPCQSCIDAAQSIPPCPETCPVVYPHRQESPCHKNCSDPCNPRSAPSRPSSKMPSERSSSRTLRSEEEKKKCCASKKRSNGSRKKKDKCSIM